MTLLSVSTHASTQAAANLAINLGAIRESQPSLYQSFSEIPIEIEWLYARDGALSAMEHGQWLGGCSLPRRAAEAMLARFDVKGAVACFLNPSHASHLRVALRMIRPEQAIIAVIPNLHDLWIALHCEDFSTDIRSHRLWFAAGAEWESSLEQLFEDHAGLPTPAQFIRTPDVEAETIEKLIGAAQTIFSRIGTRRSTTTQSLRDNYLPVKRNRLCIVAGSRFRLWNDIGHAMLTALNGQNDLEQIHFDADDPACASPLALLQSASSCGAILTANTSRTDLPGLLPEQIIWITWVTTARIPGAALSGDNDRLILADPHLRETAIKSGWRKEQIHIGGWPTTSESPTASASRSLSIIVDTFDLKTPPDLMDYSSHSLLWEAIRHELSENPLTLTDANDFLSNRMTRMGLSEENFPRQRFIEKLILPAYQQGLARVLIKAKIPLRIFGSGWDEIDEFSSYAAGAIASREKFNAAIAQSTAVVHVWPSTLAHPIDAIQKPVVRRRDHKAQNFLSDAKSALAGNLPRAQSTTTALSADLIHHIISSLGI